MIVLKATQDKVLSALQSVAGIVERRHTLPVLANVNAGNDLANLIRGERVGQVCESNKLDELLQLATGLLSQVDSDAELPVRCRQLFDRQFSVQQAVRQIVTALSP